MKGSELQFSAALEETYINRSLLEVFMASNGRILIPSATSGSAGEAIRARKPD